MTPRDDINFRRAALQIGEALPEELEGAERRRVRQRFMTAVEARAASPRFGVERAVVIRAFYTLAAAAALVVAGWASWGTIHSLASPAIATGGRAAPQTSPMPRGPISAEHRTVASAGDQVLSTAVQAGELLRGASRTTTPTTPMSRDELLFSDGSHVLLGPGAELAVGAFAEQGASVELRSGTLDAQVVHQNLGTAWEFRAGPFDVHVVGTAFRLAWNVQSATMALQMTDGVVRVDGCGQQAREVRAPEQISLRCEALLPASAPARVHGASASPPHPVAASTGEQVAAPIDQNAPTAEDFADKGKWDEAFALLAPEFDARLLRADAAQALRMGDIGRLSGHAAHAERAYLRAAEQAPPGVPSLQLAKLYLAQGRHPEARRAADLAAQNALFAEDAARIAIDAALGLGDRADAVARARRYLHAFPDGRHAGAARLLAL